MINLIFTLIFNMLNALLNLFPIGTGFPSSVHTAFSTLGGYIGIFDVFIPISILLFCLQTVFAVEIAIFGFKTIKWIISHIPFVGGKGNASV